jgi:uncharacterized protein
MDDTYKTSVEPETYWIGVTGALASGKTSFIRTISEYPVTFVGFDIGNITGIAFDFGRIDVDEQLCLHLHGNPGGFNSLQISKPNLIGIIVMVNSAMPESFREAGSVIAPLAAYNLAPFIVAANPYEIGHYDPNTKQLGRSVEGWEIDDLRIALHVPDCVPIISCIATDKESVKTVLITLLEQVIESIDVTDEQQAVS